MKSEEVLPVARDQGEGDDSEQSAGWIQVSAGDTALEWNSNIRPNVNMQHTPSSSLIPNSNPRAEKERPGIT
jgi:hypothetical protein